MVRLFVFVPLVALAACSPDAGAPAPAAGSAPSTGAALELTAEGVARLGAETPFDSAAVHDALPPGFTTARHADADGTPTIWALRDGQIVFEVYPAADSATVGRIDAPNEDVRGPGGAHPGQTFAEAGAAALDCTLGTDDLRDRVVCRGEGVDLVFASQAFAGQAKLPDAEVLAGTFLERLVWRAG